MKNVIFISPPAAGKGTFSKYLEQKFGYNHLATGDVLRERVEAGDLVVKELIDSGKLVSDETIADIIKDKIKTLKGNPFIIDGCPRTLVQAKMLNDMFKEEMITDVAIIKLDIDLNVAIDRILGRVICSCGRSYNLNYEALKPKKEGVCDFCSSVLKKRTDDNKEKITKRFIDYEVNVKDIVQFYKRCGILYEVNANQEPSKIEEVIKGIING